MNQRIKLFALLFLSTIVLFSCSKDEDPEEQTPVTATCTDGIKNGNETGIDCGGDCSPCAIVDSGWTMISLDNANDAVNSGMEAIGVSYRYDEPNDKVLFKIYIKNLSPFSSGPAADFSFGLPNGTDNGDSPGYHWSDQNQTTPVHRTAYVYCDPGGSAPSSYTYNIPSAQNRIEITSTGSTICSNCIDIEASISDNWIVYTIDRNKIISDTEMGGDSALIKLVVNAGHDLFWDDNVVLNGSFLIVKSTSTPSLATLNTNIPTAVTNTSADLSGEILSNGGSAISQRGFCYGTLPNPSVFGTTLLAGSGSGSFVGTLTGLIRNTTYYVRTFAVNSTGTAYGNEVSFTTANISSVPTVVTSAITTFNNIFASCNGNVTDDGGSTVSQRGVVYSTSSNPTTADLNVISGSGTGAFTCDLFSLTPRTTYYVRAYAINNDGVGYGNEQVFTTNGIPDVSTTSFLLNSETDVTVRGEVSNEGGLPVTTRGVCYGLSPNPTLSNSFVSSGSGIGTFNSQLTGLIPATRYYARTFATNVYGTAYGNEIDFFTLVIGSAYQGGTVIFIDQSGMHGLVVADSDLDSFIRWWEISTTMVYSGATGTAIGTGLTNTISIVNAQGNTGYYAAKLCNESTINGYSDWYLPSKDELNLMYINRSVIPNLTLNQGFWSSSEKDLNDAWIQNLTNGNQSFTTKLNSNHARPIRNF